MTYPENFYFRSEPAHMWIGFTFILGLFILVCSYFFQGDSDSQTQKIPDYVASKMIRLGHLATSQNPKQSIIDMYRVGHKEIDFKALEEFIKKSVEENNRLTSLFSFSVEASVLISKLKMQMPELIHLLQKRARGEYIMNESVQIENFKAWNNEFYNYLIENPHVLENPEKFFEEYAFYLNKMLVEKSLETRIDSSLFPNEIFERFSHIKEFNTVLRTDALNEQKENLGEMVVAFNNILSENSNSMQYFLYNVHYCRDNSLLINKEMKILRGKVEVSLNILSTKMLRISSGREKETLPNVEYLTHGIRTETKETPSVVPYHELALVIKELNRNMVEQKKYPQKVEKGESAVIYALT